MADAPVSKAGSASPGGEKYHRGDQQTDHEIKDSPHGQNIAGVTENVGAGDDADGPSQTKAPQYAKDDIHTSLLTSAVCALFCTAAAVWALPLFLSIYGLGLAIWHLALRTRLAPVSREPYASGPWEAARFVLSVVVLVLSVSPDAGISPIGLAALVTFSAVSAAASDNEAFGRWRAFQETSK